MIDGKSPEYGVDSRYASDEERKADGKVLMAARLERMKNLSPELIIQARLLSLKFRMEDSLLKDDFKHLSLFTEFLSEYIDIIYDKKSRFAEDIDISSVKLSHFLNRHREPQEEFLKKLMIHSELTYKNVGGFEGKMWYRIYFQEKIARIMSSQNAWRPDLEKRIDTSFAMGA